MALYWRETEIVVPSRLCREMLSIIHQGHLGQEKCLLRARTSIFWPGLTKDVISQVKECDPCHRHQCQKQKQPIVQLEPASYPWQRLNSDLFEFKGHEYLLLSDQYSKFPVIRKPTSMSSQTIVTHLKSIFAEHGIPAQPVSNNGPQYSSKEFKNFKESYGIEHFTSSSHYPQANGSSECIVQTVKNILTKCDEEGDSYLALLSYRDTPIDHHLRSPAELLTNRKFRILLPMSNCESLTADSGQVKEQLKRKQGRYGHHYDRKAKSRPNPRTTPPRPASTVTWPSYQDLGTRNHPESSERTSIKNNTTEGVYWRTRSHLRPDTISSCAHSQAPVQVPTAVTRPPSPFREVEPPTSTVGQTPGNSTEPRPPAKIEVPPETCGGCRTRSERTVKPPDKLNI